MIASQKADAGLVARLLAAGADVNATNANGGSVLMFAAIGGDAGIVGLLLDAGARHDARANLGWTALGLAAVKGHVEDLTAHVRGAALDIEFRVYALEPGTAPSTGIFKAADYEDLRRRLQQNGELLWVSQIRANPWVRSVGRLGTFQMLPVDLDVEVAQKAQIADPVISTTHTGHQFFVRSSPLDGGARTHLDFGTFRYCALSFLGRGSGPGEAKPRTLPVGVPDLDRGVDFVSEKLLEVVENRDGF